MMNFSDVILCLMTGLAVPLVFSSLASAGVRALIAEGLHARHPGLLGAQLVAAFACGPGLLAERLIGERREDDMLDRVLGWMVVFGWAALYGYVLLSLTGGLARI